MGTLEEDRKMKICKTCFHYNACLSVDAEDRMFYVVKEDDCDHYLRAVCSPEDFLKNMKELDNMTDTEERHIKMDDLMADLLTTLGYGDGIQVYVDTEKWHC